MNDILKHLGLFPSKISGIVDHPRQDQSRQITLLFPPKAWQELEKVMVKTGRNSTVEVLREALTIYSVIVEHRSVGGKVVFKNINGSEEQLNFPRLPSDKLPLEPTSEYGW
ncbi:MAG: hypothetical protein KGJ35_01245 [Patescibacteria group bacterium]|nr:hypothetical protein [Patescibacteria group bacterium]